jgi:hypothetical protein
MQGQAKDQRVDTNSSFQSMRDIESVYIGVFFNQSFTLAVDDLLAFRSLSMKFQLASSVPSSSGCFDSHIKTLQRNSMANLQIGPDMKGLLVP